MPRRSALRTAAFALMASVAAAVVAPAAYAADRLRAEVLLVTPNHSGRLPPELASMRSALRRKGYTGATIERRATVDLRRGQEVHVDLGRRELDLTLLSSDDDLARVSVRRGGGTARITEVTVDDARFLVTAPR